MKKSLLYVNLPQFGSSEIVSSKILDTRILLEYFLRSIEAFPSCIRRRPGLSSAVAGLYRTADNFLLLDDHLTPEEQYRHMYPLRCWLIWFPESFVSLTQGDIWVLIMLAHFYALTLAVIPIFPVVNTRMFINARIESISSILNNIRETQPYYCQPCSKVHVIQQLMQFPDHVMEVLSRLNYGTGPYDDPLAGAYHYGVECTA